ncbi:hypothetical protein AVEN_229160-1 [Araneus ventricosus]|uniref:Uncharacterized protein n=1 Tax=Araneus ventricosus TaxID=182803 RepID=A0A4Y2EL27_ARAVE|nr:hypothetical protein AVEN_229160-1 [Araneus ventricosus]
MAELIAIQQAVQYARANYLREVNIICDSRSALMALSSVEEAREMGNFGNERADQLAKEATLISDERISFVPSRNQIRNEGNKIIKDLRQNRWND